jgi:hypothetical protein
VYQSVLLVEKAMIDQPSMLVKLAFYLLAIGLVLSLFYNMFETEQKINKERNEFYDQACACIHNSSRYLVGKWEWIKCTDNQPSVWVG